MDTQIKNKFQLEELIEKIERHYGPCSEAIEWLDMNGWIYIEGVQYSLTADMREFYRYGESQFIATHGDCKDCLCEQINLFDFI